MPDHSDDPLDAERWRRNALAYRDILQRWNPTGLANLPGFIEAADETRALNRRRSTRLEDAHDVISESTRAAEKDWDAERAQARAEAGRAQAEREARTRRADEWAAAQGAARSANATREALQAERLREKIEGEFWPPYMALFVGDRPEDEACATSAGIDFEWAADWRARAGSES